MNDGRTAGWTQGSGAPSFDLDAANLRFRNALRPRSRRGRTRWRAVVAISIAEGVMAAYIPLPVAAVVVGVTAGVLALLDGLDRSTAGWERLGRLIGADQDARWRADFGARMPRKKDQWRRWLAAHPPDSIPPLWRASLLMRYGSLSEARDVIATLSTATALDRYRRAWLTAAADRQETGVGDMRPARDAATAITDPQDRDRALASLALQEAYAWLWSGGELRDLAGPPDFPTLRVTAACRWCEFFNRYGSTMFCLAFALYVCLSSRLILASIGVSTP